MFDKVLDKSENKPESSVVNVPDVLQESTTTATTSNYTNNETVFDNPIAAPTNLETDKEVSIELRRSKRVRKPPVGLDL